MEGKKVAKRKERKNFFHLSRFLEHFCSPLLSGSRDQAAVSDVQIICEIYSNDCSMPFSTIPKVGLQFSGSRLNVSSLHRSAVAPILST